MALNYNFSKQQLNSLRSPAFVSIETCAFSGATLLSFLLGAHPRIATIGEMDGLIERDDPNTYLCSCGKKIRECDFWRDVGSTMREKGFELDVTHFNMRFDFGGPWLIRRIRMGSSRSIMLDSIRDTIFQTWPKERRQIRDLVSRNEAFVESVLYVMNKDIFVDSSKDDQRVKHLRRFSKFDTYVIHLVRDVRGFVVSQLSRRKEKTAAEIARLWVKVNRKIENLLESLPNNQFIRVRYEDLCSDVQGTLDRLYRFCRVDPVTVKDFRSVPQHIVGNSMRLRNSSEIALDERWKTELSKEQLRTIDQIAGTLYHRYGYE